MRTDSAVGSQPSAPFIAAGQPHGQYVAPVEPLMYDKPAAREQLKDLVDTAAVDSAVHMESVESGVIRALWT